jgi:hypothetical protein
VDLYRYVSSLQPDIIINNRVGQHRKGVAGTAEGQERIGDYGTPEQFIPPTGYAPGVDWESCMTMNDTWGYKKQDQNFKPAKTLIRNLVDIASKGGNYLLNVGPTGEGLIPETSVERLAQIGRWMKVNGDGIYATSASPFSRQLPWGRCTQRVRPDGSTLYLHVFDWPADGELLVPGLKNRAAKAWLLADAKQGLASEMTEDGLVIRVPRPAPDEISSTVVVQIEGDLHVEPTAIAQQRDGSITLPASEARLHGSTFKYEVGGALDNIGYWTNPADWANWEFKVRTPGKFTVTAVIAAPASGSFDISLAALSLHCAAPATGSYTEFKPGELGVIDIPSAGMTTLAVRPVKDGWQPMNLRSIKLTPLAASSARQRVRDPGIYYCYYGPDRVEELVKYDMVILHAPAATSDVVKQLKERGVVTIGYISCGEDETLRVGDGTGPGGKASWYFDKDKDGKPDTHAIWKSIYANSADAKWRADRVAEAKRLVETVGFDGIFLDTVDDVTVFPETFDGMVQLINDFRRELPQAPIIMNQSWELLTKVAPAIDGLMLEGFSTSYDFEKKSYRRNPPKWDDDGLAMLQKYVVPTRRKHPFQVFVLDYAKAEQTELIQAAADRAATFGFQHAVAPVTLDEVYSIKVTAKPDPKWQQPQTGKK